MQLVKYEAACRAVAEAKTIDEAKEIIGRAEALRAYARQAKNRQMEIDAIEIKVRGERRVGEIIGELKKDGSVVVQGVRSHTERGQRTPIKLADLGIDSNLSSAAQRLAMLPETRFSSDLIDWRSKAETAVRLETPFQVYRRPSIRGDRQKAAARHGRNQLDHCDPFDKYRTPDGRRIADWRAGELNRLADIFERVSRCAETLYRELPVANPDPLATMEMIFAPAKLTEILDGLWSDPITQSNAGLRRGKRESQCEHCGAAFIRSKAGPKERAGLTKGGRFCSRACVNAARKSEGCQ